MSGGRRFSRRQLSAMTVMELLLSSAERLLRGRSRPRPVPVGPIARVVVEVAAHHKFPRTMRAVVALRWMSQDVLPRIFRLPAASSILERELTARPERTQARLAQLEALVRASRPFHGGTWGLHLPSAELRDLTLDGARSGLLERANLSDSSLFDLRIFGSLSRADFRRARLSGVSFIGCSLERASLVAAVLEDVVLASGTATRCTFDMTDFSHCTLSDMDLTGSTFVGASLHDVVFERCDLARIDITDAVWEEVDLIDCRNVEASLAELEHVNVSDRDTGPMGHPRRTALGATPRSLARHQGAEADGSISVRYARAMSRGRPPFGYRLQTLGRDVSIWVALGSEYHRVRLEYAGQPEAEYHNPFPKNRLSGALRTLLGAHQPAAEVAIAGLQYRALIEALREQYPSLQSEGFPQLVVVDGDFPHANFVDLGNETYIVISGGMLGMTIRLARYCIAWVYPPAISYMDAWPAERDPRSLRNTLAMRLREVARSRGDFVALERIQVTGMRDMQANCLTMTFLRFVLGHELAHFLQSRGVLRADGSRFELETQADVLAARLLRLDPDLDGDANMLEAVRKMSEPDMRAVLRIAAATTMRRETRRALLPGVNLFELDPKSEEFVSEISRFADCDWFAAAVTAFIVTIGGSAGYHGTHDSLGHVATVIRDAFSEELLEEVTSEMASAASVLGMLHRVFYSDEVAA
jgi:uncharacterized protein YjbI with pentapeptide repeats